MMTKIDIAKKATSFVVGVGVTKIVNAICINNTQPQKITDKVTVVAGAIVLGMIASDVTSKYTDAKIDELVTWYNINVKK